MSSRVLRKLHGDKEQLNEDISDVEPDLTSSGGTRKKQLNVNRYDLLNQQSHSESEVKEDDNETETNKSGQGDNNNHESVKRKKRKKKKKSGKSVNNQRSSEDNADIDEVERSVREVNRLLGDVDPRQAVVDQQYFHRTDKIHHQKTVLSVYSRNLNPNNELKRIFGSKIIQSEQHKKKNRGGQGGGQSTGPGSRPSYHHMRHNMSLVTVKDPWPQVSTGSSTGLFMSVQEFKNGAQYFAYEHSPSYRQVQRRFLLAVESLNPDHVLAIIRDHPYHVDALLQLSDLCRLNEDLALAAELVERALYCLECAFHPLFSVTSVSGGGGEIGQGGCRLDYRRQENRAIFITLFKHLLNVGGRACYRTALELCKLLLALDPDIDPLAAKLTLDFYALRAKEYQWLIQLCEEFESSKNLSQLPNFAYGLPVAHYRMQEAAEISGSKGSASSTSAAAATVSEDYNDVASQLLQRALITFPGVLLPLLDKCGVQTDKRVAAHSFFGARMQDKQPESLKTLINLYVQRSYHVWKDTDLLPWLEANVHRVLDCVDANDPLAADMAAHRARWYRGPLPRPICRHIVLSDMKGVTVTPSTEDFNNGVLAFDPFPPIDTINIYNRPARPTVSSSNASALGIFFRSLIPTFNINEVTGGEQAAAVGANALEQVDALNLMQPPEDAAGAATAGAAGNELRRSVASLVDAMHYLLNNMRPANAPTNNDEADVDENDESSDTDVDADHNNYLT